VLRRIWISTTLVAASSALILAQGLGPAPARVEFEVASVKPSETPAMMFTVLPGGRLTARSVPLRFIIRTAYQLQSDQIVGGPDWLDRDRFDITAKAADAAAPARDVLWMLQTLLADRFKLALHNDTRELPVYALIATDRNRAAPGFRATTCPDPDIDLRQPRPCANIATPRYALTLRGMPMAQLLPLLSPIVSRVVVDRTGLADRYDIDLKWSPELAAGGVPADPDTPNIFTAIQEQLGLRLEASRAPIDVLVIDRVERPTPD
jgi:uncharacterized protein (TIGR03435 family)